MNGSNNAEVNIYCFNMVTIDTTKHAHSASITDSQD